jgi:hypothetical protein
LFPADAIEECLGHLAAGAVVDTNEQDFLFHVWGPSQDLPQQFGSRMQRQANIAAAAPSGGAMR